MIATTATQRSGALEVDLADATLYSEGNPEQIWAVLRAQDPVHWNARPDGSGFWALTRHRTITQVMKDPVTFSSQRGMRLGTQSAAGQAAAGKMLIVTDPPAHRDMRAVLSAAFTPRMIRRLEQNMRVTVAESIALMLEADGGDFDTVASRLPVSVISDMLGIPAQDWDFMLRCTRIAFGHDLGEEQPGERPTEPQATMRRMMAHADLMCYYTEYLEYRRRHPGEDLVTAMLHGQLDGRAMTDEEIFLNCDGLISGGNETTRHAAMSGVLQFAQDTDQWDLLRRAPELLSGAVQEILRFASPALHVMRTATADTVLEGRKIAEGDQVTLWLPSGNRDEEIVANGDAFDITRAHRTPLTFGAGPHHCLGARLAEFELRILFDELLSRVTRIELAGQPRRLRSNLIWGIESLPVRLTPHR